MLVRFKVGIVALAMSLGLGLGLATVPAAAQAQIGLVNVVIDDINVTVPIQAAANIAANVCGVQLPVLSVVGQTQTVTCTSRARSGRQAQFTLVRSN
jgi:hypothetical protein